MHVQAIKEPFDHDNGFPVANGAVEIKQHQRLAEANRKLVPRFGWSDAPSSVSYQDSVLVVDRENDPTFHRAIPRIEAYAEVGGCVPVHPALREVQVVRINCKELKG